MPPHTPTEHSHTPTTPEPCHVAKVSYYIDYFLSGNRQVTFPGPLHVAVLGDVSPVQPAARGHLKSTTPEEQRHALVIAIGRAIGSGQSDVELGKWRRLLLSTTVTFTKFDNDDDLFWAATNQRESVGAQYEVVYFSTVDCRLKCTHLHVTSMHRVYIHRPLFPPRFITRLSLQVQRLFQLMAYKAKQEASGTNLTHAQLADLYSSKVSVSSGEKVNRDYVGAAVYVYKYILTDVNCRALVLQACPTHNPC